jgi:hypothetical protein
MTLSVQQAGTAVRCTAVRCWQTLGVISNGVFYVRAGKSTVIFKADTPGVTIGCSACGRMNHLALVPRDESVNIEAANGA